MAMTPRSDDEAAFTRGMDLAPGDADVEGIAERPRVTPGRAS